MVWVLSPQEIKMLSLAIKSAAVILVIATTTFDQLPGNQPDNANNQSEATVSKQSKPASKRKHSDYPRSTRALRSRLTGKNHKQPGYKAHRFKISGYLGQTFVYGEVIPLKNGTLEGYIYHPDNHKTYVYGKQNKNTINLYDTNGNLYQMLGQ
jgi:hypothetical protein